MAPGLTSRLGEPRSLTPRRRKHDDGSTRPSAVLSTVFSARLVVQRHTTVPRAPENGRPRKCILSPVVVPGNNGGAVVDDEIGGIVGGEDERDP